MANMLCSSPCLLLGLQYEYSVAPWRYATTPTAVVLPLSVWAPPAPLLPVLSAVASVQGLQQLSDIPIAEKVGSYRRKGRGKGGLGQQHGS